MKFHQLIWLGLASLILAGCGSQDIPDPDPDSDGTMVDSEYEGDTDGFGEDGMGDGEFIDAEFGSEDEMTMVIYFDFDQSKLTAKSISRLNDVADYVIGSNGIESIILAGHTDSWGSNNYNDRLAEKRVRVAANYLLSKGVSSELISQYSYGENLPVEPNDSDQNRALNRRVTITLEK